MSSANNIEAILFAVAETKTVSELAKILDVEKGEIEESLTALSHKLDGTALQLVRNGEEVTLVTRAEHGALLEKLRKDELSKELSKASAETLSIICYHPGVSRAQIEFIRGVNATYSIRALSMRGLVEVQGSGSKTGYYPTTQLLEHYGVAKVEELPQFAETHTKIKKLLEGETTEV